MISRLANRVPTYNPYLARLSGIAYVALIAGVLAIFVGVGGRAPIWAGIGGGLFLLGALSYLAYLVGAAVAYSNRQDAIRAGDE